MTATSAAISVGEFEGLLARDLPVAGLFDFKVECISHGAARIRLPYRATLLRPGGTVAGPGQVALADVVLYAAVMSLAGPVVQAVTTSLNVNFLRRPTPGDLIGAGRILRLGRRLAFGEVIITVDGDPEPVAHVTGTYSLPGPRQDPAATNL